MFDGHPHPPCDMLRGQEAHTPTGIGVHRQTHTQEKHTLSLSLTVTHLHILQHQVMRRDSASTPPTQRIHLGFPHSTPPTHPGPLYKALAPLSPSLLSCTHQPMVSHGYVTVSNFAPMDVWLQNKPRTAQVSQSPRMI